MMGRGRSRSTGGGRGRGKGGERGGGGRSGRGGRGRGLRGTCTPKNCVCPSCGNTVEVEPGRPCNSVKCPKCGTPMMRGWG